MGNSPIPQNNFPGPLEHVLIGILPGFLVAVVTSLGHLLHAPGWDVSHVAEIWPV